jgi:hypothetical protein
MVLKYAMAWEKQGYDWSCLWSPVHAAITPSWLMKKLFYKIIYNDAINVNQDEIYEFITQIKLASKIIREQIS